MKKLPYLLVLSGLISVPVVAFADASPVAGNIGVTTDYIFRGISQSQHKPAFSGGFDYAHSSGLYVGTWLSNQSWVDAIGSGSNSSLEWDTYGGFKGSLPADLGYDVGLIHYQYPHDSTGAATPNTTEVYLGGSWKFLSVKYSYTVSDYFVGWTGATLGDKTRGSNYLEANLSYDLGGGWGVQGHVGHQKIKHDDFNKGSYTDWKVGGSKDLGFGTVTLSYSDTNADSAAYGAWGAPSKDVAKGVAVLSFSKSF
jgi:uncharacterized protein (TIGR02001 family)